jgi:hypothetical protein
VAAGARAEDNLDSPPFAGNLRTAPLGAWARYRTAYYGGNSRQDVQVALVARSARQATWQYTFTGVDGKRAILQMSHAIEPGGAAGPVKQRVVQMGDDQAFRMPDKPDAAGRPALRVPAPAERNGSETMTVQAGSFPCDHFHQETEPGHGYDFWVSRRVLPTAIVKFEEWTKGGNGIRLVQRTWELMETGRGVKSLVRGPVLPEPPPPPKRHRD